MIGKIKKGSGFKNCVNYILGKEKAVLLHAKGVFLYANRNESRFEEASRTYCPKLFGSGCPKTNRRENDTVGTGVHA